MLSEHVRNRGTRRDGSTKWQARFRHPSPDDYTKPDPTGRWVEKTFRTKEAARSWLRTELRAIESGSWAGSQVRTGITFGEAAEGWLAYLVSKRRIKPSTERDHRCSLDAYLLPEFGERHIEKIKTAELDRWINELKPARATTRPLSPRTRNKLLIVANGVFEHARRRHGLQRNPVVDVERFEEKDNTRALGDFEVYSRDEVWALVRAAEAGAHRNTRLPAGGVHVRDRNRERRTDEDRLDAAIYLTAALTGLRRGELLGLRWRDVNFTDELLVVCRSYSGGHLTSPKSGKRRSVPMIEEVAAVLARLGQRPRHTGDDDLVFTMDGGFLDGSALRRRYDRTVKAAGLRPLRFHDLRHTFGSIAIRHASLIEVQAWMGHADVRTTERYLHTKTGKDAASRLRGAFAPSTVELARSE